MLTEDFESFEALAEAVEKNGGHATAQMITLRSIHGSDRLGVHKRREIAAELARVNLIFANSELPAYQYSPVLLATKDSTVGQILELCSNVQPDTDQKISAIQDEQVTALREIQQTLNRVLPKVS